MWAIEQMPNANLAAFLARKAVLTGEVLKETKICFTVLCEATSFDDAVRILSTSELVADIYYTVSGSEVFAVRFLVISFFLHRFSSLDKVW